MTKFVKCINNNDVENYITVGKTYEVLNEYDMEQTYRIVDDTGRKECYNQSRFEEVVVTETFKFIPDSEVKHAIVNGVKGILIKV